MDRHVEFLTQLSRLVALYARQPDDHVTERAALRAARAAAKHGVIDLSMDEEALHAGAHAVGADVPDAALLRDTFAAAGIVRMRVAHHAPQKEIKGIAHLLAEVVKGATTAAEFADDLADLPGKDITVELAFVEAEDVAEDEGDVEGAEPHAEAHAEAHASVLVAEPGDPAVEAAGEVPVEAAGAAPAEAPPAADEASPVAEAQAEPEPEVEAESLTESEPEEVAPVSLGPLATSIPESARALEKAGHRELFERLITSSEPGTLKRLLEPVQLGIEQELRDGNALVALQLLQAMNACADLAADTEMRRQFVVVVRRLTKPTLLRSIAMLYADEPASRASVEQVLSRFGEDGAEAVADRVACAPSAEWRELYLALFGRLSAARDAVVAMLDDERPYVVERAIRLMAHLKFSDAERLLGEQLGHASMRVRLAATQALAAFVGSTFVADALARAAQDAAPEVRLMATVTLQGRREPRLAAVLAQRIDDEPELDVQLALIAALGRIAAPEGVQKLIALSMPDQRIIRRKEGSLLRLSAVEAMGEARTPQCMVTLQKLLEDRDKDVRETAARLYTRARRQTSTGSIQTVSEP